MAEFHKNISNIRSTEYDAEVQSNAGSEEMEMKVDTDENSFSEHEDNFQFSTTKKICLKII